MELACWICRVPWDLILLHRVGESGVIWGQLRRKLIGPFSADGASVTIEITYVRLEKGL